LLTQYCGITIGYENSIIAIKNRMLLRKSEKYETYFFGAMGFFTMWSLCFVNMEQKV
jgi:hypothetical protein